MSETIPISEWPRYADGSPIRLVRITSHEAKEDVFFVDWQRSKAHTCLWYEYGLAEHVRCRICGRVKRRVAEPLLESA